MSSTSKKKTSRYRLVRWFVLALVLTLVLVACQQDEPEPTPTPAPAVEEPSTESQSEPTRAPVPVVEEPQEVVAEPVVDLMALLVDELWVLVGYGDAGNPKLILPGTTLTANFVADSSLNGSAGCNNYFGGYEADNRGSLSIGALGSTQMACPEPILDQEQIFLAALQGANTFNFSDEGWLEIVYDSGAPFEEKLVFVRGTTPLENTEWLLVEYGDPEDPTPVTAGSTVTALFNPESEGADTGALGGVATCNNYSFGYILGDDGSLAIQPGMMTRMACPIDQEQEDAYLSALGEVRTYEIAGPTLRIEYVGGILVYSSVNLPLANNLWRATSITGQLVPDDIEVVALFAQEDGVDSGQVGGIAACNNYTASYTVDGESLTMGPAASTQKLCEEPLNEIEQAYLSTLQTAQTYKILGDQMMITSDSGNIVFQADRLPLEGTQWELVSVGPIDNPQPPVEGSSFTASFESAPGAPSGILAGETGCNNYATTYVAGVDKIKIDLPSKNNNEECPWGTGNFEVEQQYFLGLNSADSYTILGNTLLIIDTDGGQVFSYSAAAPEVIGVDLTPLDGSLWYLVSMAEQPLAAGTEITAEFAVNEDGVTGQVGGSAGCNQYSAPINEQFGIGPVAGTRAYCNFPPAVMEQEQAYLTNLQAAFSYWVAGGQLLINTANGVLEFSATEPESSVDQTADLQNITWYLVSYHTLSAVPGAEAAAFFGSDWNVSGTTGCNSFSGAYLTAPGNGITISGVSTTRAACPSDALTKQESDFVILMQSAVNYVVAGNQLNIITVEDKVINFTSVPPAGPTAPTAVINGPTSANVGDVVFFDGTASYTGSNPIAAYHWDFGDGSQSSGPSIQYAYSDPGTFIVTLTVVDSIGLTGSMTQQITINAVQQTPPTAAISGPSTAQVNQQVTYTADGSAAGSAAITSYKWNFGDGQTVETNEPIAVTVFRNPGSYQVTVTVVDANGLSDSASTPTTVGASLLGTDWVLTTTIPGTSINIQFTNDQLGGFAGCNSYSASYIDDPIAGTISVGPITSGMALCSEEINQQEQQYLAALAGATGINITGSQLTISTPDAPLIYNGNPLATPYN